VAASLSSPGWTAGRLRALVARCRDGSWLAGGVYPNLLVDIFAVFWWSMFMFIANLLPLLSFCFISLYPRLSISKIAVSEILK
jgi:hypothetical protein